MGFGDFVKTFFEPVGALASGIGSLVTGFQANKIATDNLKYQKDYNQQIMNREDTSYQRLVQDLSAAGLNPALAVSKSSGASSGGSTSAPQNTLRAEDIRKPFDALMNIRMMLGDLDEQEARINNINTAAATAMAKTESDIAVNEAMLTKMGIEGDHIKSETMLNLTRNENEKRKIESELEVAKSVLELNKANREKVSAETKIMVDRAEESLNLIKEQVKSSRINNQFLVDALRLENEIKEKEVEKYAADVNLLIQKYDQLSDKHKIEVAERYYNLLYASHNAVSIGTNPSRSVSMGGSALGIFSADGKYSKTGGKNTNMEDYIRELSPGLLY